MCQKCTRASSYPLVGDTVYWAELRSDAVEIATSTISIVGRRQKRVRVNTLAPGWPPGQRYVAFEDIAHDEQAAVGQLITRLIDVMVEAERRVDVAVAKMDELLAKAPTS